MKAPDHPAPSGDRTMARLLLKALVKAGFRPELASALRSWDRAGDAAFQDEVRRSSGAEADRLVARWTDARAGDRPRLWFTYHLYYKAPDWIGPPVADALRIPYVLAEASRAGKRARGAWAAAHAGAEAAPPQRTAASRASALHRSQGVVRPDHGDAERHGSRAAPHRRDDAARRQARVLPDACRGAGRAAGRRLDARCRRRRRGPPRGRDPFCGPRTPCAVPRPPRRPRVAGGVLCRGRSLRLAGRERGLRHGAPRGPGAWLPSPRERLWRRRERRPPRRDR